MHGPFVIRFYEDLEHVQAILPTTFNGISLADSPHKAGVGCLVRRRTQGLSYMALEEIKVTTPRRPPSSTLYKIVYSTSFIAGSSLLMKEMAPGFCNRVSLALRPVRYCTS
ncbi:unnamed protein product [Nezara viridula]|uniref:Uncharacterized protein n=1 Tax=Nezara viridula TaxID=85310 RepID=A0A9P0ML98_NEZVI|nr:unnamed protein product [Nezara viridula]